MMRDEACMNHRFDISRRGRKTALFIGGISSPLPGGTRRSSAKNGFLVELIGIEPTSS